MIIRPRLLTLDQMSPSNLDEFIGFEAERNAMMKRIRALSQEIRYGYAEDRQQAGSMARFKAAPPHLLLSALPGHGKTTVARLYAQKMAETAINEDWPAFLDGANLKDGKYLYGEHGKIFWDGPGHPDSLFRIAMVLGEELTSVDILDAYLCNIQAYGVLIIDEFQQAKKSVWHTLLGALNSGKWDCVLRKQGRNPHYRAMSDYGFSVVATTTDISGVNSAMTERFDQIRLDHYTSEELAGIAFSAAEKSGVVFTPKAMHIIADRGRDNPRDIVKNVRSAVITLLSNGGGETEVTEAIAREAVLDRKIGPKGLTPDDIKIMMYLQGEAGKPVGAEVLAIKTAEGTKDDYRVRERFLVQRDYVKRTARGTVLTETGNAVLEEVKQHPDFATLYR